jgi:hypothetical protein
MCLSPSYKRQRKVAQAHIQIDVFYTRIFSNMNGGSSKISSVRLMFYYSFLLELDLWIVIFWE